MIGRKLKRAAAFASKWLRSALPIDAAGSGRRTSGMYSGLTGPNGLLVRHAPKLINTSRDAVRQNGYAAKALDLLVTNAVGTGLRPLVKDKKLAKLWKRWVKEADARGEASFYGLQQMVFRSMLEGGDCFVRIRPRKLEDGLTIPMQLEVHESEMVPYADMPMNRAAGGNRIIAGIEIDAIGRKAAYHFLKNHPGEPVDLRSGTGLSTETVRVPAQSILHIRDVISGRPGELRGLPRLTRTLIKLHDLDRYDDAELVRKKSAAMFAGFYSRPLTGDADLDKELFGSDPDEEGDVIDSPEPGSFVVLPDGYQVSFSQPADVGGSYEAFMRQQLRAIAVAFGVPYHELSGDHTGLNDRSIRSVLTAFRRQLMAWQQHVLVHQLCIGVWRAFVDMALLSGAWTLPNGWTVEDAYDVEWVGQAFEHIHPVQDVDSLIKARRAGFKSRRQIVTSLGGDIEEIDADIAADADREERLGIILDSNPANEAEAPDPRPSDEEPPEGGESDDSEELAA